MLMLSRGRVLAITLTLASLVLCCAGCELLTRSVADGIADFLESSTADLLEQTFPVTMESEGGGG